MNIQHFIILDLVKLNISRDCEKKMIDSKIDSKKKKNSWLERRYFCQRIRGLIE